MKILCVFLFSFVLVTNASAAVGVRYVDKSCNVTPTCGSGLTWDAPFETIGEAVDDLNLGTGGVIYIAAGVYDDEVSDLVTIDADPVKLEGAGVGATIIAGAVTLSVSGSIIRNLSISATSGDSLAISSASDILISNTQIENDDDDDCVSIGDAHRIKIVDSHIMNCDDGISVGVGASVFINNVLVENISGYGLYVNSGEGANLATVNMANSQFVFDGAGVGGIYLGGSSATEKTYSVIANTKTNVDETEIPHIYIGTSGNQIVNHSFVGNSADDVTFHADADGNILGQYSSINSVDVTGGLGNSVWSGY